MEQSERSQENGQELQMLIIEVVVQEGAHRERKWGKILMIKRKGKVQPIHAGHEREREKIQREREREEQRKEKESARLSAGI